MDGIEQFVQAFMKLSIVIYRRKTVYRLKRDGRLKIEEDSNNREADVDIVSMNSISRAQVTKDDIYQMVLIICGASDRNKWNRSTGDTGQAVLLRDGWSAAEGRAKDTELMFKASEKRFLRLVLRIIRDTVNFDLKLSEIDIKFTRNKTDSLLVKSQGLQNQLEAGIHPQIAIAHCGLYSDPEQVYLDSREYLKKWKTAKATSTPGNNKPAPEVRTID